MDSDVEGLVRALALPAKRAMIPLFEAISNSIHAIEERFGARSAAHPYPAGWEPAGHFLEEVGTSSSNAPCVRIGE